MSFSVIGLFIVISIFFPNFLFIIFPPKNVPNGLASAGAIYTALERIGQIGCISILAISKNNYENITINIWFIMMALCIIMYWILWMRYIIKGQDFLLCFKPLVFLPIPMAIFPVLAFAFAALWGGSIYLMITTVFLAIGHFANSFNTYKLIK